MNNIHNKGLSEGEFYPLVYHCAMGNLHTNTGAIL